MRTPRYPQCARITSSVQEICGVEADGFYGRHTERAVAEMLKGFDGNSGEELLDYIADYHHIQVEKSEPVIRPADKVLEDTPCHACRRRFPRCREQRDRLVNLAYLDRKPQYIHA